MGKAYAVSWIIIFIKEADGRAIYPYIMTILMFYPKMNITVGFTELFQHLKIFHTKLKIIGMDCGLPR